MLLALDTSILVYAEGVNSAAAAARARTLLDRLVAAMASIPAPVLCELYHVLTRREGRSRKAGRSAIRIWQMRFPVLPFSEAATNAGLDLAAEHQLQVWDAIILAIAAEAGCSLLLSEDLQHEFRWNGVTVVNPFTHPEHPLLSRLLD